MRPPGWLGQTIPAGRHQDRFPRSFMIDAMSRRNEDRLRSFPRPHDASDHLSVMKERSPVPLSRSGRFRLPDEPRLRAADGRNVPQDSEMTRQSESSRVSEALPVEDDQV